MTIQTFLFTSIRKHTTPLIIIHNGSESELSMQFLKKDLKPPRQGLHGSSPNGKLSFYSAHKSSNFFLLKSFLPKEIFFKLSKRKKKLKHRIEMKIYLRLDKLPDQSLGDCC